MKNLLFRVLTSLVLLPLVILAFIYGGLLLASLLMLASLVACLEAASIIDPENHLSKILSAIFWAGFLLPNLVAENLSTVLLGTVPMLLVFNALVLFIPSINRENFEKLCTIFFWCFYICLGISSVYWLSERCNTQEIGRAFIYIACLSTWSNDTFAYFGGRLFGKNYLFPRVSGKKTWEGFITGSVCSVLFALLFKYILGLLGHETFLNISFQDILWISVPAVFLAPFGDLVESRLKRLYDKKDSSQILPGHGGLLDRIDSLLLVIPWTALYAFIIRGLC